MRPGCRAWVALAAGVAAWDVFCPEGEQLTDAARRGVVAHPVLTTGAIAVTGLHLANRLHRWMDPYYLTGSLVTALSVAVKR